MATRSLPSFGDLLRRYRLAAGLTQEDLAGLAGLSVRGLSDLERGARRAPRRETVQLLAEALHLSEASRTQLEAAARKPGVPVTSGSGSSPGGLATTLPLVGRAQELALLAQLLVDGPPVLLVAGEPGIGKSRLLQAGIERAEAQGWTVLAGGCHRRSGQDPYAPLLGALADSLQRQSPAEQRVHVQGCSWLVRLLPELAETRMLSRPSWTLPPEQDYTHNGEAEKASLYLERAGDAARSSYAYTEAADAYQQVMGRLDTLGRGAQAAQVRERLGEVPGLLGRYDEALAVLEQAVVGYRAVNDREGALRALAGIGYVHSKRGTMEEGLRRLQLVMEQFATPDSSLGAASCYVALAYLSFGVEQYQQALAAALRAATMARALGDDHTLLAAQERQAAVLGILGKLSEGHQVLSHEVIPLAEVLGETHTLIRALNNLGAISNSWGNYHEARHCVERALQLQKRLGNHKDVLFLQYQLGLNAFSTGEWQQAHVAYEQVVREVRAGARFWGQTYAFYGLGMLALAQGEEAVAFSYFEEAALLESTPDINAAQDMEWALAERDLLADQPAVAYTRLAPFLSPSNQENIYAKEYLPRLAWSMLELGEDAQAQTLLAELVAEARQAQMRPVLSEALRVQAWAWSKQHQWEGAEQALEEALALAQDLPNPYAEAKTLYIAGLVSRKRKEFEPAIQRFEAALTLLEQLGERLYARSIEQLLGTSETPARGGEL